MNTHAHVKIQVKKRISITPKDRKGQIVVTTDQLIMQQGLLATII